MTAGQTRQDWAQNSGLAHVTNAMINSKGSIFKSAGAALMGHDFT